MPRRRRKSDLFFLAAALAAAALLLMFAHAHRAGESARPAAAERAGLVERLGLTDLCLFTDARYARHPSMADRHTPFQDGPMSMEHFPSGALMRPPDRLRAP
jgi:hypothetical protein